MKVRAVRNFLEYLEVYVLFDVKPELPVDKPCNFITWTGDCWRYLKCGHEWCPTHTCRVRIHALA